jgi:type I restriction enzyme, R subunit
MTSDRDIAEQLSEEALALFDLLMKPDGELTGCERNLVKEIARELLQAELPAD